MMVHSVLEGKFTDMCAELIAATQSLKRFADDYSVEGFVKVVSARDILDGLTHTYVYMYMYVTMVMLTCVLCCVQYPECGAGGHEAQHRGPLLA